MNWINYYKDIDNISNTNSKINNTTNTTTNNNVIHSIIDNIHSIVSYLDDDSDVFCICGEPSMYFAMIEDLL